MKSFIYFFSLEIIWKFLTERFLIYPCWECRLINHICLHTRFLSDFRKCFKIKFHEACRWQQLSFIGHLLFKSTLARELAEIRCRTEICDDYVLRYSNGGVFFIWLFKSNFSVIGFEKLSYILYLNKI